MAPNEAGESSRGVFTDLFYILAWDAGGGVPYIQQSGNDAGELRRLAEEFVCGALGRRAIIVAAQLHIQSELVARVDVH
jgi:hypothetical protein